MLYKTTFLISALTSLLIALWPTDTFAQSKQTKFRIDGSVSGYDNGTILYLHDLSDGSYKKVDSTIVTTNKFSFKGTISGKYLRSAISTADFTDRATFWIQKGTTSFSAEKGNFTKAIITGSKIQQDQNQLDKLREGATDQNEAEYSFVKANPKSVISAYVLSVYRSTWNKQKVITLYNAFSKKVKATEFGRKISDFIRLNQDIKIGDYFTDFAQPDSSNKLIRLSDYKGKIILIEFWGSWCGPCREENPSLVKLYNEFKQKGFEIFGVASETKRQQWIKAIENDDLNWINVSDLKGSNNEAATIYGISGYPSNFLIDRTGIILAKDVYGKELRKWLLKVL